MEKPDLGRYEENVNAARKLRTMARTLRKLAKIIERKPGVCHWRVNIEFWDDQWLEAGSKEVLRRVAFSNLTEPAAPSSDLGTAADQPAKVD